MLNIEEPQLQLPCSIEFESIEHLQEYVVNVFTTSRPTLAEQIIPLAAWVGCIPLCARLACEPSQAEEYESAYVTCRESLDTAIARLPFHMPATFDNTMAMAMAVSFPRWLGFPGTDLIPNAECALSLQMPGYLGMEPRNCRGSHGPGLGLPQGLSSGP